jgi:hypothetical protein
MLTVFYLEKKGFPDSWRAFFMGAVMRFEISFLRKNSLFFELFMPISKKFLALSQEKSYQLIFI